MNVVAVLIFTVLSISIFKTPAISICLAFSYIAYKQYNIKHNIHKGSWFVLRKGKTEIRNHFADIYEYNKHLDEVVNDKYRFLEAHIPVESFKTEEELVKYLLKAKESIACPNCGCVGKMEGNAERTYNKAIITTINNTYLDTIWSVDSDVIRSKQYVCNGQYKMANRHGMAGPTSFTSIGKYREQYVHCNACNFSTKKEKNCRNIYKWIGDINDVNMGNEEYVDGVSDRIDRPIKDESIFSQTLSFLYYAFSIFIIMFAAKELLKKKDD